MVEVWVLCCEIVKEFEVGNFVIVIGDFNDGENVVSLEIILGEILFKNYVWMLCYDVEMLCDCYSEVED